MGGVLLLSTLSVELFITFDGEVHTGAGTPAISRSRAECSTCGEFGPVACPGCRVGRVWNALVADRIVGDLRLKFVFRDYTRTFVFFLFILNWTQDNK